VRKTLFLLLAVTLFLSSCAELGSVKYRRYPQNPFNDIKTIAILPFLNDTTENIDTKNFANIFASELVKFEGGKGFEVIRPVKVLSALQSYKAPINTIEDLVEFGKFLKVDALIAASITDYDQYPPPKLAISVQMFRIKENKLSNDDINKIIQSASWKPFRITDKEAGNVIAAIERVYDSHKDSVRSELQSYAKAHYEEDYAFKDGTLFMYDSSRYQQFVSSQILLEIMSMVKDEENK